MRWGLYGRRAVPIDTLKTRLQSAEGFFKAGGFRGIYSGLSAAALGSAPGAALFFDIRDRQGAGAAVLQTDVLSQQAAASAGESWRAWFVFQQRL